jgi:hypothetical protein
VPYGAELGSKGTNFDSEHLVTAAGQVEKAGNRDPMPEWGKTLKGEADVLKTQMKSVVQGINGINARLDKLTGSTSSASLD